MLLFSGVTNSVAQNEPWLVEGNQKEAHLGQTVARAGVVNGDGYGDLLVGGRFDFGNGGTGVAYAYYGSARGPDTLPDWIAPKGQPNQYAFLALAGAGVVNGDGYDDVVIGSFGFNNPEIDEGRALLYYGSTGGPSSAPGWTVEGNQHKAHLCNLGRMPARLRARSFCPPHGSKGDLLTMDIGFPVVLW